MSTSLLSSKSDDESPVKPYPSPPIPSRLQKRKSILRNSTLPYEEVKGVPFDYFHATELTNCDFMLNAALPSNAPVQSKSLIHRMKNIFNSSSSTHPTITAFASSGDEIAAGFSNGVLQVLSTETRDDPQIKYIHKKFSTNPVSKLEIVQLHHASLNNDVAGIGMRSTSINMQGTTKQILISLVNT